MVLHPIVLALLNLSHTLSGGRRGAIKAASLSHEQMPHQRCSGQCLGAPCQGTGPGEPCARQVPSPPTGAADEQVLLSTGGSDCWITTLKASKRGSDPLATPQVYTPHLYPITLHSKSRLTAAHLSPTPTVYTTVCTPPVTTVTLFTLSAPLGLSVRPPVDVGNVCR